MRKKDERLVSPACYKIDDGAVSANAMLPTMMNRVGSPETVIAWAAGATLTDKIAAVATFVRNQWGNVAPGVTEAQVKAIREENANRAENWTAAELQKLSAK